MRSKIKFCKTFIFFALLACKEEVPEPVLVEAAFSPELSTIKENGEVSFTDESTNSPTTREWIFEGGDPSSSTEKSPIVIYNTPGEYQVTLTVTGEDNSDKATGTVTVEELVQVIPDFESDTTKVNVGKVLNSRISRKATLTLGTGFLKEETRLLPLNKIPQ